MRELTDRQQKYAEFRLSGYSPTVLARLAGYADNGSSAIRVSAHRLENHQGIQDAMEKMRHARDLPSGAEARPGRPEGL